MPTQIRGSNHHFAPFYHDNSILIQFVIEEFIQVHQFISKINTLNQNNLDPINETNSCFESLIPLFKELIDGRDHQDSSFSSRWTRGSLTKLKEYCEQFSHNSLNTHKQTVYLHMAAHQMWLMAVHSFELLNSLHPHDCARQSGRHVIVHSLKRSFHRLMMRFNQLSRHLSRAIRDYGNNENVIYYLLRRKEWLADIYGQDFLYQYFKGTKKGFHLIDVLLNRYQARGFETLLPSLSLLKEQLYEVH